MSINEQAHTVDLPEGVTGRVADRQLSVKGPLGTARKNFDRIHVDIEVKDGKIVIRPFTGKKKDLVSSNTVSSLARNMVTGVTKGYTYKLKVIFAHFPVGQGEGRQGERGELHGRAVG